MISSADFDTLVLTVKIATTTTVILLILGTPLAWWLARTRSGWKGFISSLVALPLVLPPSVLGFYLLVLLGPSGPIGKLTSWLGMGTLPFSFSGLLVCSVLYSLPFVIQPLQAAFTVLGQQALEAAATLRSDPISTFFWVVLPLAKPGYLTATILGFAHTIGEFGVVLMVGGNIPDKTRVVSVQIYNHVEALEFNEAHWLAGGLLVFSFSVLFILYTVLKTPVSAHQFK